jgi:hypothetical protein
MTEGMNRGFQDDSFKLYTYQKARLIQLEEENRHLRYAPGDMRSILVARQGEPPYQPRTGTRRSSRSLTPLSQPGRGGRFVPSCHTLGMTCSP